MLSVRHLGHAGTDTQWWGAFTSIERVLSVSIPAYTCTWQIWNQDLSCCNLFTWGGGHKMGNEIIWLKWFVEFCKKVNDFCANISQKIFRAFRNLSSHWATVKAELMSLLVKMEPNNLCEFCISIRKVLFSISKSIELNTFIYKKNRFLSAFGGSKKHPPPPHPSTLHLQEEVTRLTELNSPEAVPSSSPKSSPQGRLPVMQPKSFTDPKTVPLPEEEVQILELNAQGGLWQSEAFQEDLQATWNRRENESLTDENGGWELDGIFVLFRAGGFFLVVDCLGGRIGLLIGNICIILDVKSEIFWTI